MRKEQKAALCAVALFMSVAPSCRDAGSDPRELESMSPDAVLFSHVTQSDPFQTYRLFPGVDSVSSGTLNGSTAHQPMVRVSMNGRAFGALVQGSLPQGSAFPNGSVIFKQIIMNNETVLYAVISKDSGNPLAAGGWLWGEYRPDGSAAISVTRQGTGCIGCHSREQGPQHDFVRTFERQGHGAGR